MTALSITVNGVAHSVQADPNMPLLWVLRDLLNLTGTKFGCGIGRCGACTVIIDQVAIRSCMAPISGVADRAVTTIEGLSPDGNHPVQQAWLAESVAQCGYCQAGEIMTAVALLTKTGQPTDSQIDAAFSDHLCRCGTYLRIRRAIHRVAAGA
jgi:isoquinoline 1-oxidoreductase subunit alpha